METLRDLFYGLIRATLPVAPLDTCESESPGGAVETGRGASLTPRVSESVCVVLTFLFSVYHDVLNLKHISGQGERLPFAGPTNSWRSKRTGLAARL